MLNRIELENSSILATILPEVGGKIIDLISKPSQRNWLWQNPRIKPQAFPVDANFDNSWCGGWDDAFPTCDPCSFGGEQFQALGELRSLEWSVVSADNLSVELEAFGPITPIRATKTVLLADDEPELRMNYSITNIGFTPIHFLWGTHPALSVSRDSRLIIPTRTGMVGYAPDELSGTKGEKYPWPHFETNDGMITDMSLVLPPEAAKIFGHYALALEDGWYAVEDAESKSGILFQFPKADLPNLWMWINYGGWRGYHHVILEPWTSLPVSLPEAVANGTARKLVPGQTFAVEVITTLYDSHGAYKNILGI